MSPGAVRRGSATGCKTANRPATEGPGTTETGSYTLNGDTTNLLTQTRNAGAKYVIPSENEWYKAAYYDPTLSGGAGGYWTYPTRSNTTPSNVLSSTGTNNANFYDSWGTGNGGYTDPTNYLTPVGAFADSPSPYGTYDMGGDVWEWNEATIGSSSRGFRGGAWYSDYSRLASSDRYLYADPESGNYYMAFRVASVPEPGSVTLLLAGALSLLAYALRRRCEDGLFFGFQFLGDKSPAFQGRHVMKSQIVVLAVAVAVVLAAGPAQAVSVFNMGGTRDPTTGTWTGLASLDMVTVGNPGNATDPATGSLLGSVPYTYQIGKYDVTVGQYCQFLNAVAKTDTYGLYNSVMSMYNSTINITQSGSSGNYSYSVAGGYSQGANCPIFGVSWGDAARFCNWLQNSQPSGTEGTGTTETGAYTFNGAVTYADLMAITRNAGATYVIPTENEWYKAAYYDPTLNGSAGGYWAFPTKSNTTPSDVLSASETNDANYANYNTGNCSPIRRTPDAGGGVCGIAWALWHV